jgi:cation:H+ antiporter
MSSPLAILLFLGSALLTFGAAAFFADRLDHIGPRLGLPEAVVGLVTAAAADAPEISSALASLVRGDKQVGLGVVLGASVFNVAAMVGASAVLTGRVRLRRPALIVEGVLGLVTALVALALVVGALPAWLA